MCTIMVSFWICNIFDFRNWYPMLSTSSIASPKANKEWNLKHKKYYWKCCKHTKLLHSLQFSWCKKPCYSRWISGTIILMQLIATLAAHSQSASLLTSHPDKYNSVYSLCKRFILSAYCISLSIVFLFQKVVFSWVEQWFLLTGSFW